MRVLPLVAMALTGASASQAEEIPTDVTGLLSERVVRR